MKKNRKRRYIVFNSLIMAIILAITIVGNSIALKWDGALSQYLGTFGGGVEGTTDGDSNYYASDYANDKELLKAQQNLTEQIVAEGTVLLKNDNALPIDSPSKISLFGISSVNAAVSGSGSGKVSAKQSDLAEALSGAGFSLNETLSDFYMNSGHAHGTGSGPGNGSGMGDWTIDEVPQSEYTDAVKSSYSSYRDAAIVVFSRQGGEGGDLPTEMSRFGGAADKSYLELSTEEEELLRAIKDSGEFDKTIVIINSAGAMELGFVDEKEYGVDACLWYSGTGVNGITGVVDIIDGKVSPSGSLVDTYAYDNFSSPAMQNFGDFRYVDSNGKLTGNSYVNYAEGIYVGYRYYETRYEDTVMKTANTGKYDYASTVKYPFGYGLSYTTFKWSDYKLKEKGGTYTATVTVENTGDVAGKDTVQLYAQAPYISGGVEKSSVVLVGYGKTPILEPGNSETVKITFSQDDIATYDENSETTWILDAGTYYVTAANDAHEAINNILAAKGYTVANGMTSDGEKDLVSDFELSNLTRLDTSVTGTSVTNQFDNAEAKDAKYLSRSNWKQMDNDGLVYATDKITGVSKVTDASGTAGTVELTDDLKSGFEEGGLDSVDLSKLKTADYPGKEGYNYDADNGVTLISLMGRDYDDPLWDELLDEMKLSEMHTLFNSSGYGTAAIENISKPKTYEYDGPAGISNFITGASSYSYPSSIMVSATFNSELASQFGLLIGEDGIKTKTSGWYAPGLNTHRTPFAGRNYEYYSEDSFLTGNTAAAVINSVQQKGIYVYMKHFALNDQETNRAANGSVSVWSNEQAIREIYLKPFQMGVEKGGAKGIMTSLNRIGTTFTMLDQKLLTNVARNEWGFEGIFITDYTGGFEGSSITDKYLAAGGNMILATTAVELTDAKTNWCRAYLREATHRTLYTIVNSLAMNGMDGGSVYKEGTPIYKILLIILDVVVALSIIAGLYFTLRTLKMSEDEFAERRMKSKKRRMIIWCAIAIIFVILLILFWIFLWPILQTAFLM